MTLQVVFNNDQVVVLDKPPGWLSVPSRLGPDDPRPCVGIALQTALGQRLWPVHRLDLEVTGLLLFAKHEAAHRCANQWFEQRQVKKRYEALSDGATINNKLFRWEARLLRGKKRAYESPHGKPSLTTAQMLKVLSLEGGPAILWQLEPHTGRPHQLRFELSRHGFPILGDTLYGSQRHCPSWPTLSSNTQGNQPDASVIGLRCVSLNFAQCPEYATLGLPECLVAPSLPRCLGLTEAV